MKQWILVAAGGLLLLSCNKSEKSNMTPATADVFEFCSTGSYRWSEPSYCFRMEQGKIYRDSVLTTTGRVYHTVPMPPEKYTLAMLLINNFPAYLLQHPNTDYGCIGCPDRGCFFLKTEKGNAVARWGIDKKETEQPAQLKPYLRQMDSVINHL